MSLNTVKFLGSVLATAGMVISPLAASAGGINHAGAINRGGMVPGINCRPGSQPAGMGAVSTGVNRPLNVYTRNNVDASKNVSVYKPVNASRNIDASKNTSIYKPVNINKNIDNSKNISVYKPVEINKNIDASKNTSIYKPVTITKNIDNSKNISITKNINIEKNTYNYGGKGGHGGSNSNSNSNSSSAAEAAAIAAAVAAAFANSSSSSNAVVNFNGGSNTAYGGNGYGYGYGNASASAGSESYASAFGYSGAGTVSGSSSISESFSGGSGGGGGGGDIGTITVAAPTPAAVVTPTVGCTFQDTTVIKAIHAVCVSADSHEFPASHMVGDTWLDAGYEGEIARCLPGSHLKVILGAVFQSSEGMASNWTNGQTLECGAHEALRHLKGGMLKCAVAMPVPDCTERTNLRKFGTGDMFFTYRAKVCMETHQEYVASESREMNREEEHRGYSSSSY